MTTAVPRTMSDLIRHFDEECTKTFRFLIDDLYFSRAPIEEDAGIGVVRYSKGGVEVRLTYSVLDHDVIAHVVRRGLLRRQAIRVGRVEIAGEDDLGQAVSALAAEVEAELEAQR
jgi:hypothetical protein